MSGAVCPCSGTANCTGIPECRGWLNDSGRGGNHPARFVRLAEIVSRRNLTRYSAHGFRAVSVRFQSVAAEWICPGENATMGVQLSA